MSGGTEVATDRGLPLQWWHLVAGGAAVWALYAAANGFEGAIGPQLYDLMGVFALLVWPVVPVAMYLDVRSIREEVAWAPATKSWLLVSALWIANVPAGLAYCIRRRQAVRGELPSPHWRFGVYAGVFVWVGVIAVDVAAGYVGVDLGPVDPVLTGLLIVGWVGLPVAVYFDAVRFDSYPDQQLRIRLLVALSAVPLLNVLLVGGYAVGRWWHRRSLDPDVELAVPGATEVGTTLPEPLSPWYRRAASLFVVYVVLVFAVGFGLSLESDGAWIGLELVAWLPFGVLFTACLHLDLRDVRDAGVQWGGTRYLYYTSAAFPGPAFYYLLRRLHKVNRARRKGLLDDDAGGGDGAGDATTDAVGATPATSGPDGPERAEPGPDGTDAGGGFEWGEGSRG